MKIAVAGFLALIMGIVVGVVGAQEAPTPDCDVPALVAAYDVDAVQTLEGLMALRDAVGADVAACRGLAFEGERAKVLGPLDIPVGLYLMTYESEDADGTTGAIQLTVMDGSCDDGYVGTYLWDEGPQESLFASDGCRVLLEFSGSSAAWTLSFELIE